jgi:hypothetical protein
LRCRFANPIIILVSKTLYEPGADPGFQVRGRGAHLKKMRVIITYLVSIQ